jgi:hypothetical protein
MLKKLLNKIKSVYFSYKLSKELDKQDLSSVSLYHPAIIREEHESYKLGPVTCYVMGEGEEGKRKLKEKMLLTKTSEITKHLELTEQAQETWLKN